MFDYDHDAVASVAESGRFTVMGASNDDAMDGFLFMH